MHCTGIVKPSGNEPVNCKVREIFGKIVEIANKIMLFVVDEIKINPFRSNQIKRGMTKPRCFFFEKNESIIANLSRRHFRPTQEYRKLLPEIYEKAGLPPETLAEWSQYAGCSSCPCSPGFILRHPDGCPDELMNHIFVTVVMDETEALKLMAQGNLEAFV
jgi:hypothetical protein